MKSLIQQIKIAKEEDRRVLVNRLKVKIRKMNSIKRGDILREMNMRGVDSIYRKRGRGSSRVGRGMRRGRGHR